jgi:hypothetical protein
MYGATSFDVAVDQVMSMVEGVPAKLKLGWAGRPEIETSATAIPDSRFDDAEEFDSRRSGKDAGSRESTDASKSIMSLDDWESKVSIDQDLSAGSESERSSANGWDSESSDEEFNNRSIVEINSKYSSYDWDTRCSESLYEEGKSTCSTIESKPMYFLKDSESRRKTRLKVERDKSSVASKQSNSSRKSKTSANSKSGSNAALDEVLTIGRSQNGDSTIETEGIEVTTEEDRELHECNSDSNQRSLPLRLISEVSVKENYSEEAEEERRRAEEEALKTLDEEFLNMLDEKGPEEEESDDDTSTFGECRTMAMSEYALKTSESTFSDSSLSTHASGCAPGPKVAAAKKKKYSKNEDESILASILASFSNDSTLSTRKSRFFQMPNGEVDRAPKHDYLQQHVAPVAPKKKRRNVMARTFGRIFGRRHQQELSS